MTVLFITVIHSLPSLLVMHRLLLTVITIALTVTHSATAQNNNPATFCRVTWSGSTPTYNPNNLHYCYGPDGRLSGRWEVRYPTGEIQVGVYYRSLPHGWWETRFPNGAIHAGDYTLGKKDGWWEMMQPNGEIKVGRYKDGEMHGRWETRFPDGTVETTDFVNGKCVSGCY